MPNRVVHFEIEAKDSERAKKFYTEALGWKIDQMGDEYGGYFTLTTGDPKEPNGINGGMFEMKEKKLNAYRSVIAVDDIQKTMNDIKNAGGKIKGEKPDDIPGIGLYILCEDTEGNEFGILQPSPMMSPEK